MKNFGLSLLLFAIFDFVWLGFVMNKFNTEQLRNIGRIVDGKFQVNFTAAAIVYVFMAALMALFLLPKIGQGASLGTALLWGALMGLCVYGIYDMTNLAILKDYPLAFALVDMSWGTALFAAVAAILSSGKI